MRVVWDYKLELLNILRLLLSNTLVYYNVNEDG